MRTRIAVAAGIAAVLGIALCCSCKGRGTASAGPRDALTAEVKQGSLVISVKGSGDIRARKSSKVIPELRRDAIITFVVTEGSSVKSNEVVARFNTDDLERRIKELQTNLAEAQNKLDVAQNDLEIQTMDNTSTIKKVEQDMKAAKMEIEKFVQGDEPLEKRNAELKLQTADSDLVRKKKRLEDLKGLLKETFVTEDEVEEGRMAMETAKVALDTAKIEQRLLHDYTLPVKKAGYETALAKATTEYEKAAKQTAAQYRSKKSAVDVAKKNVERIQTDLSLATKDLEALQVKSPASGIVTYGSPDEYWRRGEIQVGAKLYPGQVLMTVPEMSSMIAAVNVSESDIRNVRTGQVARVRVEAMAGRLFEGEVIKVAEVANAGGWLVKDVKDFKVEVSMKDGQDLKPGFSCEAEIVTETILSALSLPMPAVFREEDRYFVYPAGQSRKDRVEVKLGRASARDVEILSGVTQGMKVLLTQPEK